MSWHQARSHLRGKTVGTSAFCTSLVLSRGLYIAMVSFKSCASPVLLCSIRLENTKFAVLSAHTS